MPGTRPVVIPRRMAQPVRPELRPQPHSFNVQVLQRQITIHFVPVEHGVRILVGPLAENPGEIHAVGKLEGSRGVDVIVVIVRTHHRSHAGVMGIAFNGSFELDETEI